MSPSSVGCRLYEKLVHDGLKQSKDEGVGYTELSFSIGDLLDRPWVFYHLIKPGLDDDKKQELSRYRFLAGMKRSDVMFGPARIAGSPETGRALLAGPAKPMVVIEDVHYDKFLKILEKAQKSFDLAEPSEPGRPSFSLSDWIVGFDVFGDEHGLPFFPFFLDGTACILPVLYLFLSTRVC